MKFKKYILLGVFLACLVGAGRADVFFTDPVKSGNNAGRNVEVNSVKSCSIVFKNNTGSQVVVDAAKLYINWDPTHVVGGTISFTNGNGTFTTFTPTVSSGHIYIDMYTNPGVTIPVNPGSQITLVNISYTVANNDALDGQALGMVWDTGNTSVILGLGNQVTGSVLNYTQLAPPDPNLIVKAAPPQATISAITQVKDAETGNELDITSIDNATDDRNINGRVATTYYDSGAKCRYRIRFNELTDPNAADITDPATLLADVPGLSEIQTVAGNPHQSLKDGVRYFYKSLAKDDTLSHNEEGAGAYSQNGIIVKAVPHDRTPPAAFGSGKAVGDKTFNITITPPGLDGGTYLVMIKKGSSQDNSYGTLPAKPGDVGWWWNVDKNAVLYNAANFNGTPADDVVAGFQANSGSLNGWVYAGKGLTTVNQDTFTSKGMTIENGINYYVAVIACDAASVTQPGNQGYNWQTNWTEFHAKPGIASGDLQDFFALTSGEVGSILFDWQNPASVSAGLGGVRVVYTTNRAEWANLTADTSMLAKEFSAAEIDTTAGGLNQKSLTALTQTDPVTPASPGGLDPSTLYYFRAFTFNDPTQRLYSPSGKLYAAYPNRGGGGGAITVTLNKMSGGLGVNSVPIFAPPFTVANEAGTASPSVNTIDELRIAIMTIGGVKIYSLSFWDEIAQKLVGATYDDAGNQTFATTGFDGGQTLTAKGIFISVDTNSRIIIRK